MMVGARVDGKKELVALTDGYRESEESWAQLLRDLKKRGACGHRSWPSEMERLASGRR